MWACELDFLFVLKYNFSTNHLSERHKKASWLRYHRPQTYALVPLLAAAQKKRNVIATETDVCHQMATLAQRMLWLYSYLHFILLLQMLNAWIIVCMCGIICWHLHVVICKEYIRKLHGHFNLHCHFYPYEHGNGNFQVLKGTKKISMTIVFFPPPNFPPSCSSWNILSNETCIV